MKSILKLIGIKIGPRKSFRRFVGARDFDVKSIYGWRIKLARRNLAYELRDKLTAPFISKLDISAAKEEAQKNLSIRFPNRKFEFEKNLRDPMEVIESFSQAQTISELDSSQFAQVLELWILEQTRLELYLSLPSGQKKDEVISVFWSLVDAEVELAESLGVPGLRSSPGDVDTMRNLLSTLFKKVSDVNCCNRGCPGCLFSNGSMAGPVFG